MKRLILLLILLSIAVTAPISAEEIKLTTIVPDQTVLRAKKGAIGNNYSNPQPPTGLTNESIPPNALVVEGSIGIGNATPDPATRLDVNGNARIGGSMVLFPMYNEPDSQTRKEGMIYYDYAKHLMRYWNGSTWVDLGGGGVGAFTTDGMLSVGRGVLITAQSDGIVIALTAAATNLIGWSTYNPNKALVMVARETGNVGPWMCITFPVRKGDNWKVTTDGVNPNITWYPIK